MSSETVDSTVDGEKKADRSRRRGRRGRGNIRSDSESEGAIVCFGGVFADLQQFNEENGDLAMPVSHPSFLSIMDKLSAAGMEELLKKRWEHQLDSLKDFTGKYDDCMVPADHPTLGEWVRVQHRDYILYKKRLPSPLTKERFTKLKELSGFDDFKDQDNNNNTKIKASFRKALLPDAPSLDQKIRMKMAAKKVTLEKRVVNTVSSPKELPDKDAVATEIKTKGSAVNSQDMQKSLTPNAISKQLKEQIDKAPLRSSMPVNQREKLEDASFRSSMNENAKAAVITYEEKLKKKLFLEENRSTYVPTNSKSPPKTDCNNGDNSGDVVRNKMKGEDRSQSMPISLEDGADKDNHQKGVASTLVQRGGFNRRPKDRYLSASLSTQTRGTFQERLQSKLDGARNKMKGEDHSLSIPISLEDGADKGYHQKGVASTLVQRGGFNLRHKDRYLSASLSKDTRHRGTFQERLQTKLDGASMEDIYKSAQNSNGGILDRSPSAPTSTSTGDTFQERLQHKLNGASLEDIYESGQDSNKKDFLTRRRRSVSLTDINDTGDDCYSSTSCKNTLGKNGMISKDDIGLQSLGAMLSPGDRKFSRWILLFDRRDYTSEKNQSECVSCVLTEIIYSDKWLFVPEENGDIALEMDTKSLDEHKMVGLYVQELRAQHSQSNFFFY